MSLHDRRARGGSALAVRSVEADAPPHLEDHQPHDPHRPGAVRRPPERAGRAQAAPGAGAAGVAARRARRRARRGLSASSRRRSARRARSSSATPAIARPRCAPAPSARCAACPARWRRRSSQQARVLVIDDIQHLRVDEATNLLVAARCSGQTALGRVDRGRARSARRPRSARRSPRSSCAASTPRPPASCGRASRRRYGDGRRLRRRVRAHARRAARAAPRVRARAVRRERVGPRALERAGARGARGARDPAPAGRAGGGRRRSRRASIPRRR